jgi:hypothetical protein
MDGCGKCGGLKSIDRWKVDRLFKICKLSWLGRAVELAVVVVVVAVVVAVVAKARLYIKTLE